jgi:hypothetical protein
MRRPPLHSAVAVAALLFVCQPSAARAEHAKIRLTVESKSADTAEAFDDDEPPTGGRDKRVVAKVKVGEPLAMQFILTNVYPHEIRKDVIVRYYVVRIDKVRQKPTPVLKETKPADIVAQGQVQMNWKPKCRVGARLKFRIRKAGVYRVKVETANTKSDHEHFAAIDLIAN